MCGNTNAVARGAVLPSVIRARETRVVHACSGEPGATMDAQILPCVEPFVVRPKHQVALEESGRRGFAFPQLRNPSNGVPIINEN
jgi:hypothetical protein